MEEYLYMIQGIMACHSGLSKDDLFPFISLTTVVARIVSLFEIEPHRIRVHPKASCITSLRPDLYFIGLMFWDRKDSIVHEFWFIMLSIV